MHHRPSIRGVKSPGWTLWAWSCHCDTESGKLLWHPAPDWRAALARACEPLRDAPAPEPLLPDRKPLESAIRLGTAYGLEIATDSSTEATLDVLCTTLREGLQLGLTDPLATAQGERYQGMMLAAAVLGALEQHGG